MHLEMTGDGPMLASLRTQAERLGHPIDKLRFHRWQPQTKVQTPAAGCHLFAFRYVRELGGAVVLETISKSHVPPVLNQADSAELVTIGVAPSVPLGSRTEKVQGLRWQLIRLASEPNGPASMGRTARNRAEARFIWEHKADQVVPVYE